MHKKLGIIAGGGAIPQDLINFCKENKHIKYLFYVLVSIFNKITLQKWLFVFSFYFGFYFRINFLEKIICDIVI